MKVIEMSRYGGPEVLTLTERPDPAPAGDRVRVAVKARAVNPVDVGIRSGALAHYVPGGAFPAVPGWDFAGVLLDAAGPLAPGTRVAGYVPWFAEGGRLGTYAEILVADPAWFAALPDDLAFEEASTIPMNGLTATQSLDDLRVAAGDRVLVAGASGGVGGFAVQLAARRGAKVLALASHGDETFLSGYQVIPRGNAEAVVAAVRRHAPGGVDAILDGTSLGEPLLRAVRDGGRYLNLTGPVATPAGRDIEILTMWTRPDPATLSGLLTGKLTTRIAHRLPLSRAAEAHRILERGGTRGAVVLS